MRKRILVWLLIAVMAAGLVFPVQAAERLGSVRMDLPSNVAEKYKDQTVKMSLYKIAECYVDEGGLVSWGIIERYAGQTSRITQIMEDLSSGNENSQMIDEVISAISQIIKNQSVAPYQGRVATMTEEGRIQFNGLSNGLYYVEMSEGPETLFIQSPLVPIPFCLTIEGQTSILYDVSVKPKLEDEEPTPAPSPTPEATPTPTPTPTPAPSPTPTPTPSASPEPTPTPTPTETPTNPPVVTAPPPTEIPRVPTQTPGIPTTPRPDEPPRPTPTPTVRPTFVPAFTPTPSPRPTRRPTPNANATPTPVPTPSPYIPIEKRTPAPTPTPEPGALPKPTPPGRGDPYINIDDYDTPLGLGAIINHVGDCFD